MALVKFRVAGMQEDIYVNPDHVMYAHKSGPLTTTIAFSASAGSGPNGSTGPKTFSVEGEVQNIASQLNIAQKG